MAALVGGLAAIDWRQGFTQAWGWANTQSAAGLTFLASLPGDCKRAATHATLVCLGQVPQYYQTPGFSPLALSWGWLLLGLVLGALMTLQILMFLGLLRREPAIAVLANLNARAPGPPGLAAPQDRARDDILRHLANGGPEALQELAAASGLTEAEFLVRVFGVRALPPPVQMQQVRPVWGAVGDGR